MEERKGREEEKGKKESSLAEEEKSTYSKGED